MHGLFTRPLESWQGCLWSSITLNSESPLLALWPESGKWWAVFFNPPTPNFHQQLAWKPPGTQGIRFIWCREQICVFWWWLPPVTCRNYSFARWPKGEKKTPAKVHCREMQEPHLQMVQSVPCTTLLPRLLCLIPQKSLNSSKNFFSILASQNVPKFVRLVWVLWL